MTRRTAAVVVAAVAAAGTLIWVAGGYLLPTGPGSEPVPASTGTGPASPGSRREATAQAPRAPVVPTPPPLAPKPALEGPAPSEPFLPSGLDPEDLLYPEGARGPVVVGVVAIPWDPDPEADVALESVDDPKREDPSDIESLDRGGYRLRGFAPGRYRVRARAVGAVAVYSLPFEAKDGVVVDAGLLRLRRPGGVGGVVRAPSGEFADAEVRLFGRDPATLVPAVVERTVSVGRQGFLLKAHEAGAFRIAVAGEQGWAVVEGRSDLEGQAWVEVDLRPWGRIEVTAGGKEAVVLGMAVAPVEAPDLGEPGRVRSFTRGGAVERVAAGKYRVTVRWTAGPPGYAERTEDLEAAVAAGEAARIEVPPPPVPK